MDYSTQVLSVSRLFGKCLRENNFYEGENHFPRRCLLQLWHLTFVAGACQYKYKLACCLPIGLEKKEKDQLDIVSP